MRVWFEIVLEIWQLFRNKVIAFLLHGCYGNLISIKCVFRRQVCGQCFLKNCSWHLLSVKMKSSLLAFTKSDIEFHLLNSAPIWYTPCLILEIHWNLSTSFCLYIIYGCFHSTTKLSSCKWECMTHKPKTLTR